MMLTDYFSILVFIIIALVIGSVMYTLGNVLSKHNPDPEKNSAYECGFSAFENTRIPFDIRFCVIAILFIIFDLETAFFIPWAVAFRKIGLFGFVSMMIFLSILVVGFIYEWKRGALEWE